MKLGGWHRLWIFLSVIYLLIGTLYILTIFSEYDVGDIILGTLIFGIAPCIILYALGWAVRWVYKGFKSK